MRHRSHRTILRLDLRHHVPLDRVECFPLSKYQYLNQLTLFVQSSVLTQRQSVSFIKTNSLRWWHPSCLVDSQSASPSLRSYFRISPLESGYHTGPFTELLLKPFIFEAPRSCQRAWMSTCFTYIAFTVQSRCPRSIASTNPFNQLFDFMPNVSLERSEISVREYHSPSSRAVPQGRLVGREDTTGPLGRAVSRRQSCNARFCSISLQDRCQANVFYIFLCPRVDGVPLR